MKFTGIGSKPFLESLFKFTVPVRPTGDPLPRHNPHYASGCLEWRNVIYPVVTASLDSEANSDSN